MFSVCFQETPPTTPEHAESVPNRSTAQSGRRRKEQRRNKQKVLRKMERLDKELKVQQTKVEKYRKQVYRLRANNKTDSPRTKVSKLLGKSFSQAVNRQLLFHEVLFRGIVERYRSTKDRRLKNKFRQIIASKLLKKYRLQHMFQGTFGVSSRVWKSTKQRQPQRKNTKSSRYCEVVKQFLTENSRATSGKKETITRNKIKKQRYIMTETQQNLYMKFG